MIIATILDILILFLYCLKRHFEYLEFLHFYLADKLFTISIQLLLLYCLSVRVLAKLFGILFEREAKKRCVRVVLKEILVQEGNGDKTLNRRSAQKIP